VTFFYMIWTFPQIREGLNPSQILLLEKIRSSSLYPFIFFVLFRCLRCLRCLRSEPRGWNKEEDEDKDNEVAIIPLLTLFLSFYHSLYRFAFLRSESYFGTNQRASFLATHDKQKEQSPRIVRKTTKIKWRDLKWRDLKLRDRKTPSSSFFFFL
jgi:hypothetical protein